MLIPFSHLPLQNIRGIIHVGAHECEEIYDYIHDLDRPVIWIEANPEKVPIIEEVICNHRQMRLACFAASDIEMPNSILHIANNGQSSSLLQFGSHIKYHPSIIFTKNVPVTQQRIDHFIKNERINIKDYNMINLDVQGFELKALQGSSGILSSIDYIYTEVNTEAVYNNCARLTELDEYLSVYGFSRTWTVMTRNGWGDAFYSRGNKHLNKVSFALRVIIAKIRGKVLRYAGRANQ